MPDTLPPAQTQGLTGRFVHGQLSLNWQPATDNSGTVTAYRVLVDGFQLTAVDGETHDALVHTFHPNAQTVYRVQAVDAAGNVGKPSRPLVIVPSTKPATLPRPLPHWAWALFAWQHGHNGSRPATAPKQLPRWYWAWAGWRAAPFRVK